MTVERVIEEVRTKVPYLADIPMRKRRGHLNTLNCANPKTK